MKEIKKQKVISGFEKFVSRVFNIARHEWGRVAGAFFVRLFFQIALIAGGTVILALFVEAFSIDRLPVLFIIQSLLVIAGTLLFSGFLRKISVENLIIFGSIFSASLFFSAVFFGKNEILFFTFALLGFSVFLAQVGIWISLFIEEIFSPLEGERAFPLVESAEPVGGLLAGLLIIGILPFYDADKILVFVGSVLLVITPILLFAIEKMRTVPHLELEKNSDQKTQKRGEIWKNTIRFFRHSPFLTGLFVVIFLQFFATHFLEFQFTKAVDANISAHDEIHGIGESKRHADLLTHSLGKIHIVLYGISFFCQLLLASRILQKIGVVRTLAMGPLASFFAFFGMLASFSFSTAIVAKSVFEVGNGIGKNAFGAAFYAMRENFRAEAKEFLEGVAKPLGLLFGTTLIFFLQNIFGDEILRTVLSSILVLVMGIASVLAFHLKKHYTILGKKNLESRGKLDEKINAIEVLSQAGHQNATDYLVRALQNEIPEVRVKILKTLGKRSDTDAIPAILKCLDDPEKSVRLEAVNALSHFHNLGKHFFGQSFSRFQIINSLKKCFLECRYPELKIAAIKVFSHLQDPEIVPILINLLKKDDPRIRAESASVIGFFHDAATITYLEPLLKDPNPMVRSAAIGALWQFVPLRLQLIMELNDLLESSKKEEILAGIEALGEIKWEGEKVRLQKFLHSKNEKIRHHAAIALAKMNDESSVDHLFHFLFHEKKILGKKTRRLFNKFHEDIQRSLHKRSLHEVARRITEILKDQKTNIVEQLPREILEEIHHLFSLIEAEKEMGRIALILTERKNEKLVRLGA